MGPELGDRTLDTSPYRLRGDAEFLGDRREGRRFVAAKSEPGSHRERTLLVEVFEQRIDLFTRDPTFRRLVGTLVGACKVG